MGQNTSLILSLSTTLLSLLRTHIYLLHHHLPRIPNHYIASPLSKYKVWSNYETRRPPQVVGCYRLSTRVCNVKIYSFLRCGQIMRREDHHKLSAAQTFYPCMQCEDIFFLKVWSNYETRRSPQVAGCSDFLPVYAMC
ncbi:uncharacterized protein LOC143587154 [Bidens hawaiensis]|uniref:uncharacterized protein LOC143587154 n=1 Tax=Bidens hawaiensis TaxID=980011 RepID=UPI004049FD02